VAQRQFVKKRLLEPNIHIVITGYSSMIIEGNKHAIYTGTDLNQTYFVTLHEQISADKARGCFY
jgi:hypothetical protein